jgi:hypothetical protein
MNTAVFSSPDIGTTPAKASCPRPGEETPPSAAEGRTLVRADNSSGFGYVLKYHNKYRVQFEHNCERHFLGIFDKPEEAALCVTRWLRDHASTDDTVQAQLQLMIASEAVVAAVTEELTLERAKNASGVRNLSYNAASNSYRLQIYLNDECHCLGTLLTPDKAALRVARWLRDRA